jgi:hypothetical protein
MKYTILLVQLFSHRVTVTQIKVAATGLRGSTRQFNGGKLVHGDRDAFDLLHFAFFRRRLFRLRTSGVRRVSGDGSATAAVDAATGMLQNITEN